MKYCYETILKWAGYCNRHGKHYSLRLSRPLSNSGILELAVGCMHTASCDFNRILKKVCWCALECFTKGFQEVNINDTSNRLLFFCPVLSTACCCLVWHFFYVLRCLSGVKYRSTKDRIEYLLNGRYYRIRPDRFIKEWQIVLFYIVLA